MIDFTSRIERSIQEFFTDFRRPRAFVWVAVSGGCDSVTFLHSLHRLHQKQRLPIAGLGVVHVNHSLRGEESDGDEEFVKQLAQNLGLSFESFRVVWQVGEQKSQAACRKKRADFFRELVDRTAPCYLAMAHHEDDLAETVALRLMRGTGLGGLAAMRPQNGIRLRPWLKVPQEWIHGAAKEQRLQWREDSSNQSMKYERNWVRQQLLPLMESRRPGTKRHLAALALEAAELAQVRPFHLAPLATMGEVRFYSLASLRQADSALLHKIFPMDRIHVHQLGKFFRSKDSGQYPAPGLSIHSSCGLVLVAPQTHVPSWEMRVEGMRWESLLGVWNLSEGGFSKGAPPRGRLKKLQLPIWFREMVPCLPKAGGGLAPLVPPNWAEPWGEKGWTFRPSEFAQRIFHGRSSGRSSENPLGPGRVRK